MACVLSDFDYDLPERFIAQQPADRRDASRLMVFRRPGGQVEHRRFLDLPGLLRPDDVLVVNDTKVIPAKFSSHRETGGRIEGLFLRLLDDGRWEVLLKNARRCRPGERLAFDPSAGRGLVLRADFGQGRWAVEPDPPGLAEDILQTVGVTPLPPYIKRPDRSHDAEDRKRYQTVYAARPGAVAAPTAGLHFTPEILSALQARGIETVRVTLHVGLGTFAPVSTNDLTRHEMHSEYYELPRPAAERIAAARATGRRIVAVGTTSVRVLESVATRHAGRVVAEAGWTSLFLYPPAEFRVVDALLTNFHLPRSTLLMLVAAFCAPGGEGGVPLLLRAYRQAIREEYRFFSYGDAMLVE